MVRHRIYSYGQLFGFSGVDGDTVGARDFCATFLAEPVSLRFETEPSATLRLPLGAGATFDAIGGDFIEGRDGSGKRLLVAFEDARNVVGLSPVEPVFDTWDEALPTGRDISTKRPPGGRAVSASLPDSPANPYRFAKTFSPQGWLFRLVFDGAGTPPRIPREVDDAGETPRTPREKIRPPAPSAVEAALRARRAWLDAQPPCPEPGFEGLWAKCLAVEKVNTLSSEGAFPCRWTTPDRVPHRDAWLWDSAFHAMALSGSDPALAHDALRAVMERQRDDGFVPHQMKPDGRRSSITQPQVLAWAALYLHERAPDTGFLAWAAPRLRAFLLWTVRNRDRNGNGLLANWTGQSGRDFIPGWKLIEFDMSGKAVWHWNAPWAGTPCAVMSFD